MRTASPPWKAKWLKARLGLNHYHPDVSVLEEAFWKFCVGFASCPLRGKRLVVYGNNGTGKSKVARALKRFVSDRALDIPLVMNDEDEACLVTCMLVNWAQQVDEFKREGDWDIESHLRTPLLILDDIGAEHDPSRIGLEKLYLILERREWRWTFITTNKTPEQWENAFERRIADRLFRNCDHVDLSNLPSFASV